MDEFGVFTESFGLKPQGKAAPMAALKRTTVTNNNSQSWSVGGVGSDTNSKPSSSFLGDQKMPYNNNGGISDDFDVFGGGSVKSNPSSFDMDSFFSGSNSSANSSSASTVNYYDNDDIFGVTSSSSATSDVFGSFASGRTPTGDLLGGFVTVKSAPKSSNHNGSSFFSGDDLIPGFGTHRRKETTTHSTKSGFTSPPGDPFTVLQSTSSSASKNAYASSELFPNPLERTTKVNNSVGAKPPRLKSPPRSTRVSNGDKAKSSGVSIIDGLEDFAMGSVQNNNNGRSNSNNWAHDQNGDDLDSFFNAGLRSSSAPKSRTTTSDPIFDALNINNKGSKGTQPRVPPKTTTSASIKKSSSSGGIFGDLTSMFEGTQIYGEFEEVDGETEERRSARIERLRRTNDRVVKAVEYMNQRDFQSQQEQEERHRIAEVMDVNIKSWAAGKEGNMRALLSSLQNVLWTECGWEAVSLTDLITSTSVKKVYRKATLCIHPDKVQQKGANLQQKYIAEKVFDILKEAWNKFNKEELR